MKELLLSRLLSETYEPSKRKKAVAKEGVRCWKCGNVLTTYTPICNKCGSNLVTDAKKIACPFCGHENIKGDRICSWCNNDMKKISNCKYCSKGVPSNEEICPHCGFDKKRTLLPTSKKSRTIVCNTCGCFMNKEEKYCPYCGTVNELTAIEENHQDQLLNK